MGTHSEPLLFAEFLSLRRRELCTEGRWRRRAHEIFLVPSSLTDSSLRSQTRSRHQEQGRTAGAAAEARRTGGHADTTVLAAPTTEILFQPGSGRQQEVGLEEWFGHEHGAWGVGARADVQRAVAHESAQYAARVECERRRRRQATQSSTTEDKLIFIRIMLIDYQPLLILPVIVLINNTHSYIHMFNVQIKFSISFTLCKD